jgi:hypothetical protein
MIRIATDFGSGEGLNAGSNGTGTSVVHLLHHAMQAAEEILTSSTFA